MSMLISNKVVRSQSRRMSRYVDLTREELIGRLEALDSTPEAGPSTLPSSLSKQPTKPKKSPKPFHFPSHPTRHIALLIAYHGWPYSGLALQIAPPSTSSSPSSSSKEPNTVEGELLKALERAKLIEEGKGWEGCGYSRCGRTDRGVSGEGQVVDLWVRSTRRTGDGGVDLVEGSWRAPIEPSRPKPPDPAENEPAQNGNDSLPPPLPPPPTKPSKVKMAEELPYPRILNSILPPSIRILAWSPLSPSFNSRFSCQSRHYKYTFHLKPSPSLKPLNLLLMYEAANLLVGEHDFRNFCRLDGSKQIFNHSRRVLSTSFDTTSIEESNGGVVVFNLIGTAFLWHQVRHIMGVLFLVGSGIEPPSIISELLDVERNPGKPNFVLAHPLPLTLYECSYEDEELDWRISGYDGFFSSLSVEERGRIVPEEGGMRESLERQLEEARQEAEIRAWQVGGGLRRLRDVFGPSEEVGHRKEGLVSHPIGGGEMLVTGRYQQVMERSRGETPDEVNRKWKEKKGRSQVVGGEGEME